MGRIPESIRWAIMSWAKGWKFLFSLAKRSLAPTHSRPTIPGSPPCVNKARGPVVCRYVYMYIYTYIHIYTYTLSHGISLLLTHGATQVYCVWRERKLNKPYICIHNKYMYIYTYMYIHIYIYTYTYYRTPCFADTRRRPRYSGS